MEEGISKLHREFFMVRASDKGTAMKVKAKRPPEMVFFDGDGEEFYRAGVRDASSMQTAFSEALKKYSSQEISWASGEVADILTQAKEQKRLVVLAFMDEKDPSQGLVKSLQDRWNVKHHKDLLFVKVAYERNSEACKAWGVTSCPVLLLVNPLEDDARKRVLDKLIAKKDLRSVKTFLVKGLEKFKKLQGE